jgi:hypothetical protein
MHMLVQMRVVHVAHAGVLSLEIVDLAKRRMTQAHQLVRE